MMNPTLADLVGGIQSVTLGDEEARRRGTQKSILERKAPPTFDVVVEIQTWDRVAIHSDVAETVDAILRGYEVPAEVREVDEQGEVRYVPATELVRERRGLERRGPPAEGPARRVYPFGISRSRLEQAIRMTASPVTVSDSLDDADTVLTLRSYYRRKPRTLREAESRGIPIYVLKTNSLPHMEQCLLSMRERGGRSLDPITAALREAEEAIGQVMGGNGAVELSPQNAYIRRLQHQMAQRYNLTSRSRGREPFRRVRILPANEAGYPFEA
jgi:hypothetical protein